MSNIAVKVENLGKSYQIGHNVGEAQRYTALRDVVAQSAKALARKTRDMFHGRPIIEGDNIEEFWALRDINFEIPQGERVGVIGRNGAGKSTLLKILSRITEPTTGRVTINGRVASLLEVGTGFHPELTGRENIFLNGAILGMTRKEILRKFDEIIQFSEIEKFLDTPVKRYSSGMYVRLAFAVAAHLDTEILVVDEVLAVGDADFQKKCIGKMQEATTNGRTVIFVSHSTAAISRLTDKAILLKKGEICAYDTTQAVLNLYSSESATLSGTRHWLEGGNGNEIATINSVSIKGNNNSSTTVIGVDEDIEILVEYAVHKSTPKVTAIVQLLANDGSCIFSTNDWSDRAAWENYDRLGVVQARLYIPRHFLSSGKHQLTVALGSYNPNQLHFIERDALAFEIVESNSEMGARGEFLAGDWPGIIRPDLKWAVTNVR